MIKPILGNLIELAQEGQFDVIGHGCNCFCAMKRGIAPQMHKAFGCADPEIFEKENEYYKGDMKKLGNYESHRVPRNRGEFESLWVTNIYSQYHFNQPGPYDIPLDYDALKLALRKMNYKFKGKKVALPGLIGAGLAGGDPLKVWNIIVDEFKDCDTTIVFLEKSKLPKFLEIEWPDLF